MKRFLLFSLLTCGSMCGAAAQGILLEDFDGAASVNSWKNSTEGDYTLMGSTDKVQGDSSLVLNYNIVADQSWGGSVDLQSQPEGGTVFPDLRGETGLRFSYKVTTPLNDPVASLTIKLFVNSTGGTEEWHTSLTNVLTDPSGEWQSASVPFSAFAIPSWMQSYDGMLYLNEIREIQMQVVVGSEGIGNTFTGEILFDSLASYGLEVEPGDPIMVGELLEDFEGAASVSSWKNSTEGDYTLMGSTDKVQGDSSLMLNYNIVADQGWGGSVDLQSQPMEGEVFPDLTDETGLRLAYKVLTPLNDPVASLTIKLFVNSTGGTEEWHASLTNVLTDSSGAWQEVLVPFAEFAIPSWMQSYDSVLYLNAIREIQMQVVVGSEGIGNTFTGEILFDELVSYSLVITSSEAVVQLPQLRLYPNPTASLLYLDGPDRIDRIDVVGLNGRVLKTVQGDRRVDVSDLSAGFYVVRAYADKTTYVRKFIKH
ncbi:Por secretion system C-terminal sorting domain-containing protein [Catalinimonas alkaloidigena]|uniref:Por secretion system C-terminal sorting domain-containing protein n=1 Tax=Catalinimonas alkaloidigena TaxID=1075417 RepID=A0A1G9G875_9BACT|nr:T9SS type A sorting domain-containing protein [Catalinimonas alkaloidigena]SDK96493.1 Por secretion system C-terminal sorting domain-containing protein [Catalinimonas alkaloidigena]